MEKNDSVNSAILVLQRCSPVTLPNVNVLLRILSTLPVTSQNVFSSKLKLVLWPLPCPIAKTAPPQTSIPGYALALIRV
jgi:hypothetical protein